MKQARLGCFGDSPNSNLIGSFATKQQLAKLGDGVVWRCSDGEPTQAAILMCDVRAGRSIEVRAELSKALIDVCNEMLGLEVNRLNIEFTQHTGDEMYHQWINGFNDDWSTGENN